MISDTAIIGEGTYLYPNVFVGHHVTIGKNCFIHPNVTILDHCVIGDNVIIQAGTVIGSDAFYYNTKKDRDVWYRKMESCGRVVIEDYVEIGAGCTIDRGVSHDTRIGAGTKMDNMIHIGHDTVTGKNCLFAAQVGIAGAVEIGNGVILWGQVGVSKTLTIGDNAVVYAQSGVPTSLEGGKVYFGSPAEDALLKKKRACLDQTYPRTLEKSDAGLSSGVGARALLRRIIIIRHYFGQFLPGPVTDIGDIRLIIEIAVFLDDKSVGEIQGRDLYFG